jgi:hypothetical protein
MPWWLPLFQRRRRDWSAEEKSVFLLIAVTGTAIFFAVSMYAKLHGNLKEIGAFPALLFLAVAWLASFYVARVLWQLLAPALVKKADANAAARLAK